MTRTVFTSNDGAKTRLRDEYDLNDDELRAMEGTVTDLLWGRQDL